MAKPPPGLKHWQSKPKKPAATGRAIALPSNEGALTAIAERDADTLAAYLGLHSNNTARPAPEVIRALSLALVDKRLVFPPPPHRERNDIIDDAKAAVAICHEVEARIEKLRPLMGNRGVVKRAQADVAKARKIKPRAVREAYERVRRGR